MPCTTLYVLLVLVLMCAGQCVFLCLTLACSWQGVSLAVQLLQCLNSLHAHSLVGVGVRLPVT